MGSPSTIRQQRGRVANRRGRDAEGHAAACLRRDGWSVVAQRLRTQAGEIDLVAERDGLTALIEVKARDSLVGAAYALQPRQQARLVAAAGIALAEHPNWGASGVRFDLMLVDRSGSVRRIADAFRAEAA
jgi:putative endonuclease